MSSDDLSLNIKWRFWPIIVVSLLLPINNSLIILAIPIYFFQQGVNIEFIGILAAGTTFTYCVSPLVLNNISERIGRKRSVIIGVVGMAASQSIFYLTLSPIIFLIARLFEGFITGFIWANLQSSISDNTQHDHSKYVAKYNFSWTFGVLLGFLMGAIVLFFVNNILYIFYIAPVLVFIASLTVIIFFQESVSDRESRTLNSASGDSNLSIYNDESVSKKYKLNDKQDLRNLQNYKIPLIVPIIFVIGYCFARTSVNFIYPIKSEILQFPSYTAYLLAFFSLITQITTITLSSYLSLRNLKRIPLISLVSLCVVVFLLGITQNFYVFVFLLFVLGFFNGVLYGASLKLVLYLNIQKNTSKYASINESIIGLSFMVGPIIAAYVAHFSINWSFYLFSLIFLSFFFVSVFYARKMQ
ncbi:MAG: MFS transporter [Candidatus Lokiarchaeota archaeon]|nr:MFS transporter [Candidatus Lokiarchaeota archaeon]MBD3338268.1 MFS transporter [Candidatus Lokiarchaeota archaeon]